MGIGVGNAHGSKIFHAAPALREIQFKLKMISYRRFNAFCRSAEGMSSEAGAWFIEADHVSVTALARHRRGVAVSRPAHDPVCYPGGHAAIEPLLQSAEQTRATMGAGAVVYAMPDAIFCRHVSFDNVTAEISEGGITPLCR